MSKIFQGYLEKKNHQKSENQKKYSAVDRNLTEVSLLVEVTQTSGLVQLRHTNCKKSSSGDFFQYPFFFFETIDKDLQTTIFLK
jgi:hypothetical protein